jgi:hypothetical protein
MTTPEQLVEAAYSELGKVGRRLHAVCDVLGCNAVWASLLDCKRRTHASTDMGFNLAIFTQDMDPELLATVRAPLVSGYASKQVFFSA